MPCGGDDCPTNVDAEYALASALQRTGQLGWPSVAHGRRAPYWRCEGVVRRRHHSEPADALVTDAQRAVGKLMDGDWTTHEVNALAGHGLENEVFEGDRVIVAHHPLMLARQHQLQLDAGSLTKAPSGCAGLTVKRRLKSAMKRCSR